MFLSFPETCSCHLMFPPHGTNMLRENVFIPPWWKTLSLYMVRFSKWIDYQGFTPPLTNSFRSDGIEPVSFDCGGYMRHFYSDWAMIQIDIVVKLLFCHDDTSFNRLSAAISSCCIWTCPLVFYYCFRSIFSYLPNFPAYPWSSWVSSVLPEDSSHCLLCLGFTRDPIQPVPLHRSGFSPLTNLLINFSCLNFHIVSESDLYFWVPSNFPVLYKSRQCNKDKLFQVVAWLLLCILTAEKNLYLKHLKDWRDGWNPCVIFTWCWLRCVLAWNEKTGGSTLSLVLKSQAAVVRNRQETMNCVCCQVLLTQ